MAIVPRLPETPEKAWFYRILAFALIGGAALLHLAYLIYDCPLDLAPDEAHYWHWSQRLDWSYYSKGPLVALLIRASCWLFGSWSEQLTGTQMAAVRIPAILCSALLLTSLYVLSALFMRREKLALLLVALTLTLPIIAAGSLLMTIDAPYTCCWGWALVFLYLALFRNSRVGWLGAGVCIALGVLAKYTMVLFVPMAALALLCTPSLRRELVRPGFWLMSCVGALGGLPILIWNMQHEWLTLKHTVSSHVGVQGENATRIHWLGPLSYIGLQCALLLVYWFLVWITAMAVRNPAREGRPEHRFLWFMSMPMFLFFMLFALKNGGGEPNWPITAYLSGMIFAGDWLLEQLQSPIAWIRRGTRILVPAMACLGLVLTVAVHEPRLLQPLLVQFAGPASDANPAPIRQFDPTCRLRGWRSLAHYVDQIRQQLGAEGPEPLLAGATWNLPGELGFYCQGNPDVLCLGGGIGDRHSQYDLWKPNPVLQPEAFKGRTFIVVGASTFELQAAFDSVEPSRRLVASDAGQPVAFWNVTVCRGYHGFPDGIIGKRPNY